MTFSTILMTIAFITLIESIFLLAYPKQTKKILQRIARNPRKMKRFGVWELIISVILLSIALIIQLA